MNIELQAGPRARNRSMTMTTTHSRNNSMRLIVSILFCTGLLVLMPQPALSFDDYPSHPIRVIVPAGAGSAPDINARRLGDRLSLALGQPVIVDNRSGAGGIIGTQAAAQSPPDGYTLYFGSNGPLTINPVVYDRLPYDPVHSFAPISLVTRGSLILLVNADLPVRNLEEFIAWAKARPGQVSFGTPGVGSTQHAAGELLNRLAGVQLLHVPYKDEPRAIADTIGGHVQAVFAFGAVAVEHVRAGRLRALAIAGAHRNSLLPELATAAEQGMPAFEAAGWLGYLAPAGTLPDILARLQKAIAATVREESYASWIASLGSEPVGSTSPEFSEVIRRDLQRWQGTSLR